MFDITVTEDAISFYNWHHKRVYPNTPANYDALSRMLDNRSARPTPVFDMRSNRVFVRGRIGSYANTISKPFYTVYWVFHNMHFVIANGIWFDARTDPRVIETLLMLRNAALNWDGRVTITYTTGDSESGYVVLPSVNGRRLLRLYPNSRSSGGGLIWTEGIESIRYSNARNNPKERPFLYRKGE